MTVVKGVANLILLEIVWHRGLAHYSTDGICECVKDLPVFCSTKG